MKNAIKNYFNYLAENKIEIVRTVLQSLLWGAIGGFSGTYLGSFSAQMSCFFLGFIGNIAHETYSHNQNLKQKTKTPS